MLDSKCFPHATTLFQIPEFYFHSSAPAHLLQHGWIQADSWVGSDGSTKDPEGNLIWSECVKSSDGPVLLPVVPKSTEVMDQQVSRSLRSPAGQGAKPCLLLLKLMWLEWVRAMWEWRGTWQLKQRSLQALQSCSLPAEAASLPLSGFLFALTARFSPLLFCVPVIRAPMWLCSVLFSDN